MSIAISDLSPKRRATRQAISDVATKLFAERGFDQVTVDDIASEAGVGRMTVFSYFPRKDEMFFDLDEYGRAELLRALEKRDPKVSPIEALRLFAHRIVEDRMPFLNFSAGSISFIETINTSEALKARARAIRDEITALLAKSLAETVGRRPNDTDAYITAAHAVTSMGLAFVQSQQSYRESQDREQAQSVFLRLIEVGTAGLNAMMAGTPYAQTRNPRSLAPPSSRSKTTRPAKKRFTAASI